MNTLNALDGQQGRVLCICASWLPRPGLSWPLLPLFVPSPRVAEMACAAGAHLLPGLPYECRGVAGGAASATYPRSLTQRMIMRSEATTPERSSPERARADAGGCCHEHTVTPAPAANKSAARGNGLALLALLIAAAGAGAGGWGCGSSHGMDAREKQAAEPVAGWRNGAERGAESDAGWGAGGAYRPAAPALMSWSRVVACRTAAARVASSYFNPASGKYWDFSRQDSGALLKPSTAAPGQPATVCVAGHHSATALGAGPMKSSENRMILLRLLLASSWQEPAAPLPRPQPLTVPGCSSSLALREQAAQLNALLRRLAVKVACPVSWRARAQLSRNGGSAPADLCRNISASTSMPDRNIRPMLAGQSLTPGASGAQSGAGAGAVGARCMARALFIDRRCSRRARC